MPEPQRTKVIELSRAESLELLQYNSYVGRLGFLVDGQPLILPVNYLATDDSIVFCTTAGTKLSAAGGGAQVVFEVDESRPLYHAGWSVIVRGSAQEITDPDELERLRRGPLHSWAVSPSQRWVHVSIDEITGRRILED